MSAVTAEGLYLSRWIIFFVRSLLCTAYGLVQFIGKPGSRLIVPALLIATAYAERLKLERIIDARLLQLSWQRMQQPATLEIVSAVGLAILACVCVVLWPCLFYARIAAYTIFGMLGLIVRLTVLLLFIGIAAALYYDLPLNSQLVNYLPFGMARFVPTEWPGYLLEVSSYDPQHLPKPDLLHTALAIAVLCMCCVYVVLSRVIVLLLGAFPPIAKPLPPMRDLQVTRLNVQPVPVTIAVPRLPRRKTSFP